VRRPWAATIPQTQKVLQERLRRCEASSSARGDFFPPRLTSPGRCLTQPEGTLRGFFGQALRTAHVQSESGFARAVRTPRLTGPASRSTRPHLARADLDEEHHLAVRRLRNLHRPNTIASLSASVRVRMASAQVPAAQPRTIRIDVCRLGVGASRSQYAARSCALAAWAFARRLPGAFHRRRPLPGRCQEPFTEGDLFPETPRSRLAKATFARRAARSRFWKATFARRLPGAPF
jgi:hypothetical protein